MKTSSGEIHTVEDALEYLNYQFPSTRGHLPLEEILRNVWMNGYNTGLNEVITFIRDKHESTAKVYRKNWKN